MYQDEQWGLLVPEQVTPINDCRPGISSPHSEPIISQAADFLIFRILLVAVPNSGGIKLWTTSPFQRAAPPPHPQEGSLTLPPEGRGGEGSQGCSQGWVYFPSGALKGG